MLFNAVVFCDLIKYVRESDYEILSFVFVFPTSNKTPHVRIFWHCCDFKEFTPKISDIILQNRSCMN